MQKTKIFLLFIVFFLGGILSAQWLKEGAYLQFAVLLALALWKLFSMKSDFKTKTRILIVAIIAVCCGVGRFWISFQEDSSHIRNYTGYVQIQGCVADEIDVRADKVKYTVEVSSVRGAKDTSWRSAYGRVLVSAPRYPVYFYGDCFLVKGELQKPEKIEDFYYDRYLARYSIYSVMYRAQISKIDEEKRNIFYESLYKIKSIFEEKLSKIFSEPYASFMAGLILGSRSGIPEHLKINFNVTGLTHIIAISGYNIALVITVVSMLFGFLRRRPKVIACGIFIVVFVIAVGASASVVRAAIMGIISLIALWGGRQYFVIIALFSAAFFMNLWNPKILVYDAGFQLSFLATFGIIIFNERLKNLLKKVPEIFSLRDALVMTLSAQILALPIIIMQFGRLSIISPLANIFVIPMIPLAMALGFFAVMFGFISSFIGDLIGFGGYLVLKFIIFFVNFFASFKLASLQIEWITWWMVLVYYLFLFKVVSKSIFDK